MPSLHLTRYVLKAAFRDRLFISLLVMIALGTAFSIFMGSAAVIERTQFALVFGSAGLRLLGVLGLALFTAFYVRRAFEAREVEFLLARPISRTTYLTSHVLSFLMLAFIMTVAICALLFTAGKPDIVGLATYGASIFIEFSVVMTAGLFFGMVITSAAGAALATLGFYVLARMMGILLGISQAPQENALMQILSYVMQVVSVFIPRFDLIGQSSWLIYGVHDESVLGFLRSTAPRLQELMLSMTHLGFVAAQGVVFILLLLAAAVFDLSRKQF